MTRYWEDEHLTVPDRWNNIPEQARWGGEWNDFRKLPRNDALRYLVLWHHKFGDNGTGNIDAPTELEYLELSWSNTQAIGALPSGLMRLELHYCTKLESAQGLAASCPGLRHLHLNHCKKFRDLASLLELKDLEVLCLNTCGDIPDLKFLAGFGRLRDFRFVDTKVVDGDLSPLLTHPRLESVGTLDKKHYSHKAAEIEAALAAKASVAVTRRTRRCT
jgi:hypothetical protein